MSEKAQSPKRKRLLIAGGVVLAFIVVLPLIIPALLSGYIRGVVVSEAATALDTEVELKKLGFSLIGGSGEIGQLSVKNPDGFESSHMLTVERAAADVDILPLLGGKISIASLELKGAKLFLERNSKGRWNFEPAAESAPAGKTPAGKPAPTSTGGSSAGIPNVYVGKIRVSDVAVEVVDRSLQSEPVTLFIRDLAVEADDIGTGHKGKLRVTGRIQSEKQNLLVEATIDGTKLKNGIPEIDANIELKDFLVKTLAAIPGVLLENVWINTDTKVKVSGSEISAAFNTKLNIDKGKYLDTAFEEFYVSVNGDQKSATSEMGLRLGDGKIVSQAKFSLNRLIGKSDQQAFTATTLFEKLDVAAALKGIGIPSLHSGTVDGKFSANSDDLKNVDVVVVTTARNVSLPPLGEEKPFALPDVKFMQKCSLDSTTMAVSITEGLLQTLGIELTFTGKATGLTSTPEVSFEVQTNPTDLANAVSIWPQLETMLPVKASFDSMKLTLNASGTDDIVSKLALDLTNLKLPVIPEKPPVTLSTFSIRTDSTFSTSKDSLDVRALDVTFPGFDFKATATVSKVTVDPTVDLTVKDSTLDLGKLTTLSPVKLSDLLGAPSKAVGMATLSVNAQGNAARLAADIALALKDFEVATGSFNGAPEADGGMLAKLDNGTVKLNAGLDNSNPGPVSMSLDANSVIFKQLAAAVPEPPVKEPGTTEIPTTGEPSPPTKEEAPKTEKPELSLPDLPPITAKIAIKSGDVPHLKFQNLLGNASLKEKKLVSDLKFDLFGGSFNTLVKANLQNMAAPDYTVETELSKINIGEASTPFTGSAENVLGLFSTKVSLSGKGVELAEAQKNLNGNCSFDAVELGGKYLDVVPMIADNLAKIGPVVGFKVPDDFRTQSFRNLDGALDIKAGEVSSDNISVTSEHLEVRATTNVGLDLKPKGDVVFIIKKPLADKFGERSSLTKNEQGDILFPTYSYSGLRPSAKVVGEVVGLLLKSIGDRLVKDVGKKALDTAKNLGNVGKETVGGLLKDGAKILGPSKDGETSSLKDRLGGAGKAGKNVIGNLLGGLGGKKDADEEKPEDKPAESEKEEPKKGLKGLLKKFGQ